MIENYEKFLAFLNNKLKDFFEEQKPYISCHKGCAKCCKNAEFPFSFLEFKYLLMGFLNLDKETQDIIENNISKIVEQKEKYEGEPPFLYDCPFLINDECSVYDYRGIVCRTFGLITEKEGDENTRRVPFCINDGLNYSIILDKKHNKISGKLYKKLGIKQKPLGYNVGYKFLTGDLIQKRFNIDFGEKKALIDWFLQKYD